MTEAITPQCYAIDPGEVHDSEPCDCCGEVTRSVTGFVSCHGTTVAAYVVRWTLGCGNQANWEFILGAWGDGTSAENRHAACALYRRDDQPSIMIVDADNAGSYPRLAAHRLKRTDIIGTLLAQHIFAIYDTIVLDDGRLAELHPWRVIT